MDGGNGWNRYQERVLFELGELRGDVKELREENKGMREDLAGLKVKSGVWGGLAGLIPFAMFIGARVLGGAE